MGCTCLTSWIPRSASNLQLLQISFFQLKLWVSVQKFQQPQTRPALCPLSSFLAGPESDTFNDGGMRFGSWKSPCRLAVRLQLPLHWAPTCADLQFFHVFSTGCFDIFRFNFNFKHGLKKQNCLEYSNVGIIWYNSNNVLNFVDVIFKWVATCHTKISSLAARYILGGQRLKHRLGACHSRWCPLSAVERYDAEHEVPIGVISKERWETTINKPIIKENNTQNPCSINNI